MTTPAPNNLNWLQSRGAGVLLHPVSFPGNQGIGTLGEEARTFIDFLTNAGMGYWQVCPLGPTGYGDSPYQCFSAFAGNPYLIDLRELIQYGLLTPGEIHPMAQLQNNRVDYSGVYHLKPAILRTAFQRFQDNPAIEHRYGSFESFWRESESWLPVYALFRALKDHFEGLPWYQWPLEFRDCRSARRSELATELEPEVRAQAFAQYCFFAQWKQIRQYANERKVRIIGDIPIFVSRDSADVWQNPRYFELDETFQPVRVAGVPPDYFSESGQLWGNPLYRWDALKKEGYGWWMDRMALNFQLFDVVRIDHFRGFAGYFAIPGDATDARKGTWEPGPGIDFFAAIARTFTEAPIILEDLGVITPDVVELREATGLPGMAVLQFAFDDHDSAFLPHRLDPNTVLYPGSHDNDTTLGWYQTAAETTKDFLRRYLRVSGEEVGWDFVRTGYQSVARLFVVPLQDLLSLGSEARFNTPGQPAGNWQWRYDPDAFERMRTGSTDYLRYLGELYGRLPTNQ